ncbi:MAG: RNA polymerase sigma factor [Pseudomonadota bacterium]
METSDEALAEAAGQGDRAAFATLVDRHYDLVFRLCWRLTGSETAAEDLAQDVCLKLPRALRSFRQEAKFTTWLYRVALNAVRDDARKAVTRAKALEGLAREPVAPTGDGEALSQWLSASMARLKPDLAETAALIVGAEMTQADAAEALGVSPGTVAWRMSEVKKALAAMAAKDGI